MESEACRNLYVHFPRLGDEIPLTGGMLDMGRAFEAGRILVAAALAALFAGCRSAYGAF